VLGQDIGGVDFIVFQKPSTIGITGNVQTESSEHLSSPKVSHFISYTNSICHCLVKVVLYRSDESVMSVVSPDTAGFFELLLPISVSSKVKYHVVVLSRLPAIGLHCPY